MDHPREKKRYDHNNLQINTEAQSLVGFAVNEAFPDKCWHVRVLRRKYVHDDTRNPKLSSKWIVLKGNLTEYRKSRVSDLVGLAGECFKAASQMREIPRGLQISL